MGERVKECPRCGETMRPWTLGGVTVDGCDVCGGVWFDAHELAQAAAHGEGGLIDLELEFDQGLGADAGGGDNTCPNCRTPLRPYRFPHAPAIALDVCASCKGIWFDNGELEAMARRLPASARVPRDRAPEAATMERLALAVGTVRRRLCPVCEEPNPDSAPRCHRCGADLHARPAGGMGNLLSTHRYRLGRLIVDALVFALIAAMLLCEPSSGYSSRRMPAFGDTVDPAIAWSILGGLLALYALRWVLKPYRIDAWSEGLLLHSLLGRRFVPYAAICSGAAFDLGPRALWYPYVSALRGLGGYGPYRGWAHREALEEMMSAERGKVLLVLHTTRGLVCVGPDLERHIELIDRIRERM